VVPGDPHLRWHGAPGARKEPTLTGPAGPAARRGRRGGPGLV